MRSNTGAFACFLVVVTIAAACGPGDAAPTGGDAAPAGGDAGTIVGADAGDASSSPPGSAHADGGEAGADGGEAGADGGEAGVDAASSSLPFFYGGNAHWDYSWTSQQIVDHMHQVGMTMLRMDTGGYDPSKFGRVHDFAVGIGAIDPKIKIFACISGGFDTSSDEATNYATAFNGAKLVAQSLSSAGITDFECGNELLTDPSVFPTAGVPGDRTSDYTGGASWQAMRGAIRGMIDGVKSVSPTLRTGVNFTIAQIAASDMLWSGTEPDGSGGHPKVRWDITTWHNYQVYGDLFSIGTSAHGNAFNLIEYIANAYGVPIMITEWNGGPEETDAQKTAFTNSFLDHMYGNRLKYRIESTMLYQLDGGPPDFGLFAYPMQTAAYAAFSAAHPTL